MALFARSNLDFELEKPINSLIDMVGKKGYLNQIIKERAFFDSRFLQCVLYTGIYMFQFLERRQPIDVQPVKPAVLRAKDL